MRPSMRWVLFAVAIVAVIAVLSIYALRTSPVTPPLEGAATDGGSVSTVAPTTTTPAATPSESDAGTAGTTIQPASGDLRDPQPVMQVVLLPLKKPLPRLIDPARKLAKKTFPALQVVPSTETDAKPPALLIGEIDVPGVDYEELQLFGRGLDDDTKRLLNKARKATVLEFHLDTTAGLEQVKQAQAFARDLAVLSGAALYDGDAREYFNITTWVQRRVDAWSDRLPVVPLQVGIHSYPATGGRRSVTYGMAKFGLPDLVIQSHPAELAAPLGTLTNLVAQTLVERGQTDGPGHLVVAIDGIQEPQLAREAKKMMRGNASGRTEVLLGILEPQDGDPQNRLLELNFGPANQSRTAMEAALRGLFGP